MRKNEKRLLAAALLMIVPALAGAQTSQEAEYDAIWKEIEGLQVYNALLERQIEAQQAQIADMQTAMAGVPDLERQLPPLLITMVDALDEFVRLDIPFLTEERSERVAELQLLIERGDVDEADKFRRILEAWQIETEYGSTFDLTTQQLEINGTAREVDLLQVGRIALLYQTTDDEALSGAWDARNNTWVSLGSEHRNSIRQALRMARNQIAPDLVLLPIVPAE
jgi:hypothetical protein